MDMDYSKNPQRNRINKKSIKENFVQQVKKILSQYSNMSSPTEIEKKAKQQVKAWDKECGDAKSPEEYSTKMTKKFSLFEQQAAHQQTAQQQAPMQKDPYTMVQEMKDALPRIKHFKETTKFIGQNDLRLLDQLISFIENYSNSSPESLTGSKDPIKLYYERLFIPIHKTITKKVNNQAAQQPGQMPQSSSTNSMNQSPAVDPTGMGQRVPSQSHLPPGNMHQPPPSQMPTSSQGPPLIPVNQMHQHQQKMAPTQAPMPPTQPPMQIPQPPMQTRARTPPQNTQMPPQMHPPQRIPQSDSQNQMADAIPEPKKQIQNLFSQVRSECAVFYATPHPPHF